MNRLVYTKQFSTPEDSCAFESKQQRELSEFKQVKEWPIVRLNYVQCSSRPGLFKEFFPENKSP